MTSRSIILQEQVGKDIDEYPAIAMPFLVLFCGYVIIWYLQIGYRIPFLGEIRFEFIYAACLTGIAFWGGGKFEVKCVLVKYILLYFIVLVLQIPFSVDLHASWYIFLNRIVKFAFMAVFIIAFVKSPRDLKFFLAAFMLACIKMGQEGFVGNLSGSMIWENQGILRLYGSTPLYGHPNSYAGMALGTVPFIYFLMAISPIWIKAVLLIQLVLASNIIIFSGSRTAYVGCFVFVLLCLWKSTKKGKFIFYGIALLLIVFWFVPGDYVARFESIFTMQEREGNSIEARREIMRDAWQIFWEHPFGVGLGAFPKIRKITFGPERDQDTHNLYLEVATNLGVQGIVVFGLFVYTMLRSLLHIEKSAKSQNLRLTKQQALREAGEVLTQRVNQHLADLRLVGAASSAVFAFIIIRLALGLFGMDLYEIYWWFACGLTISMWQINRIAEKKTNRLCRGIF